MSLLSSIENWVRKASIPRDIILTVVSALVGWAISHYYYVRALDDMKADAEERRRVEELVFRGIEAVGNLRYSRDPAGRVVGVVIELRGNASAEATTKGDLSVTTTK